MARKGHGMHVGEDNVGTCLETGLGDGLFADVTSEYQNFKCRGSGLNPQCWIYENRYTRFECHFLLWMGETAFVVLRSGPEYTWVR